MTEQFILDKVKKLINLTKSPNENEALAARLMADKLILKYNITEEELESLKDKKPVYIEEDKLYSSLGIEGWRNQLSLAICTKYDCYLIQEENVPTEGLTKFKYFVIGDPNDVANVRNVFTILQKEVEELVLMNCMRRGPIYIASYCEGVVDSIKENLQYLELKFVDKKKEPAPEQKTNQPKDAIEQVEQTKKKPLENSTDINSQSLIKDIGAYFKGLYDGKNLSVEDLLELDEGGIEGLLE